MLIFVILLTSFSKIITCKICIVLLLALYLHHVKQININHYGIPIFS